MECSICRRIFSDSRRKRCNSCNTKIRRYRAREHAIKVLGGCCVDCGYTGDQAAFDFHHTQGKKEFNIGSAANKSWSVIKEELKKCVLLCAVCHRLRHILREDNFLEEVTKYNGTKLK